jgi:hypothetical protein
VQTVERLSLREALSLPDPVVSRSSVAAKVAVTAAPAERRVSFADIAKELLGETPAAVAESPDAPAEVAPILETIVAEAMIEPEPTVAAAAVAVESVAAPLLPEPELVVATAPAEPEPVVVTAPVKPEPVVVTPAAVAKPVGVAPAAPAISGLPQEFEGLKFPNDGVLTRQWMEFLSQMSSTK